jgi:hypothetical protein
MKPSNKASTGAETPASFADLYASNDPGVSAPGKPLLPHSFSLQNQLAVRTVESNS